ncbi:hypothetical protein GGR57DRAFT_507556 [Xylariaceae sp. FL1272]|nr:hypothetical protein GGR57DRAFT_507556 [Xylariaceae sp. FL1272]
MIHLEGHGRELFSEKVEAYRTVGWFTTIFPVWVPSSADATSCLALVREVRGRIPYNGWDYFTVKHHTDYWRRELADVLPELTINYYGRFYNLERDVNIEAAVDHDRLHVQVIYNKHIQNQSLLSQFFSNISYTLRRITSMLSGLSDALTALTYPLRAAGYQELDYMLRRFLSRYYRKCPTVFAYANGAARKLLKVFWVVQMHPILRTVFWPIRERAKPYQVVLKAPEAVVEVAGAASSRLEAMQFLEGVPDFNFAAGIPWHRLSVCVDSDTGDLFCRLEISHVITDGTAMEIFLQDWSSFYRGENTPKHGASMGKYVYFLALHQRRASREYWFNYFAALEGSSGSLAPSDCLTHHADSN